jgi:threonine dehydrogenase-like Zn-dependent dehydrogenase
MRAVVTREAGTMEVRDVAEPSEPAAGEVLVRPEAIGVCGSDYHFLTGELALPPQFGPQFPRVQGHEFAAIVDAVGPDCPPELQVGGRVAVWPLSSCGRCYACRIGRGNVCPDFRLIGIHTDGALQERLIVPAAQAFPVGDQDPVTTAFVEPTSIAAWAVHRGRVAEGERVAVLGAGPIGQATVLCARARGAEVLITDFVQSRLDVASAAGAEPVNLRERDDAVGVVREWSGGEGPQVVVDCTGSPAAIRDAVDMVVSAGRVVIVGISQDEVRLPIWSFTAKEFELLGSSVCDAERFAEAVRIVGAHQDHVRRLITHERPLEEAPAAIDHAMRNPADVMKLVIRAAA